MTVKGKIILVLGGANSGKSEWGESLALNSNKSVVYIATGQKNEQDREWMEKIEIHRSRRPEHWLLQEIPLFLADSLLSIDSDSCILIDSLGTWVANWLEEDEEKWEEEVNKLRSILENTPHQIILIGEETGWGVVPAYQWGRLFRSRLGKLTRLIGTMADTVYLTLGGYAVDLSQIGVKLTIE